MLLLSGKQIVNHQPLAATIGFFDGVHLGHQHLIRQVIEEAKDKQCLSAVVTFANHPRKLLQPAYKPQLLTSTSERIEYIEASGIDCCILLDFTVGLSQLSARQFIGQVLKDQFAVKSLIVGYDHQFGKDRSEDYNDYARYAQELGLTSLKADVLQIEGQNVSSSFIRDSLLKGDIATANRFLNRPYTLTGVVAKGQQIGRTIGFPTANIEPTDSEKVIPSNGVYAAWVTVDKERFGAMLNIGVRPTIGKGFARSIEANLFDFSADIYGKEVAVEFVARLREERKMNGLEELKTQLATDKANAISVLNT